MEDEDRPFPFDILNARYTRRDVLKGALVAGAGVSVASLLAACGSSTSSSSSSASPTAAAKQGGNLQVGIVGGSANERLDGQLATTEPEIAITFQLYDALLGWDQNYTLTNLLAEEVSSNANATVWTVKLRKGVVFHDGTPMTADDVVYSYNRIINPKAPGMGATQLAALKSSGIKKVDASTVRFTLDTPNSVFDEAMAVYGNTIVPVGFNPKKPIGTGPFKLKSFSPGEQIAFTANKDYWGEVPRVDTLTIIEFADPTARVNALLGGTVDAISDLPSSQVKVLQSQGMKLLDSHTGGWQPFTMRIDVKPFSDVRVRQAFRLIVDRPGMISQAYDGYGWVGNDMYAPFDPGTPKPATARPGYRPSQVAAQAGGLRQRPDRHPDHLRCGRRLGSRRCRGLRRAGQGRRRHRQREQGRPEHLLRQPVPQLAVRPGLLVHAQLPGPDGPGYAADGPLQRDPLEERAVAQDRPAGLQDRRQGGS